MLAALRRTILVLAAVAGVAAALPAAADDGLALRGSLDGPSASAGAPGAEPGPPAPVAIPSEAAPTTAPPPVAAPTATAKPAPAPDAAYALALPGFLGLPPLKLRTILIALHLVGFAIGLGGVTMLDFWILRWMRGWPVTADIVRTFQFVSKAIGVALAVLWASGIGFVALYQVAMPDLLVNPKLWAKTVIVVVLTANGIFVHRHVLPVLISDIGGPLFQDYPPRRRSMLFAAGALSGVSWYAAFALGTFRELNGAVPAARLLALWFAAVLFAWAAAELAWRWRAARRARTESAPTRPAPAPVVRAPKPDGSAALLLRMQRLAQDVHVVPDDVGGVADDQRVRPDDDRGVLVRVG
ncbi:hypothetical protein OHA_1_02147 [Pleomorphomonas sp. SM30]|uniref:Membrane protein DUF2214 n=1 Tax=Oharaeibacter diazotrophicus TaxID=1920512 RepID=A0A4R6RAM1_9HYPH|nr:hypothetical protein EDD54_3957 [Oharaeibacter diazotrophicus]BBE72551.1 hypothetical protein OHA_1_02147 [Pleomorphomonas sp. SM30]